MGHQGNRHCHFGHPRWAVPTLLDNERRFEATCNSRGSHTGLGLELVKRRGTASPGRVRAVYSTVSIRVHVLERASRLHAGQAARNPGATSAPEGTAVCIIL